MVLSYSFIVIELLFFWTLYYHFIYTADEYKTSYVLYWPFHIICFAVSLLFYIFAINGVLGIISNDTMLLAIVTYKVLYSFGWQLIMIYLIYNYIMHKESYNLRIIILMINIVFITILIVGLFIHGDITFHFIELLQINEHGMLKIYETLILFYLLMVYKYIHTNKIWQYLSYITIIIGNIMVILYAIH
ncbi:hypothetical protein ASN18_2348 [Candidatus Magnetominusculus xianensis]|uniref:Uncharacterized protein n=1 Tax=Candidatus Magnetominusculus xianensis TaxID=1748249 RepID=A0ABR5SDC1_9BACT|nr:hypothetical protein ASN18_2348 [Candidatus Magnetominusculus xianensis]